MAISTVGVIFSHTNDDNLPEISRHRTMASVPFGGRYRLVDFALSNMVNAGITTVGLVTQNNYQSLIDHLGSGKEWDLARKDGGIVLLPPYLDETKKTYGSRLEALMGITPFLNRRTEEYVVISDCDGIARMDIADIIRYHLEKHADITLVYHEETHVDCTEFYTVAPDETGRLTEIKFNPKVTGTVNLYVNVMVMSRELLINLIRDAIARGFTSFGKDILIKNLNALRIFGYGFKGYFAAVDSLQDYFAHSMELLSKEVRDQLFGARDIYTKVRDSAPTRYLAGATVANSLISDGCIIEGTVENSILFRGVKIGRGSVVKNCVMMQDTVIENNVALECVITDKNATIREGRKLFGCEKQPYFVPKGRIL